MNDQPKKDVCGFCDGTGKGYFGQCRACKGTGRLTKEQFDRVQKETEDLLLGRRSLQEPEK